MTHYEWIDRADRVGWLKMLCQAHEQEHDWDEDEDPSATRDMLRETMSIHAELLTQLGECPPGPKPIATDPDMPF